MLLEHLQVLSSHPGWPGHIMNYLSTLVRLTTASEWSGCRFQTVSHLADVGYLPSIIPQHIANILFSALINVQLSLP